MKLDLFLLKNEPSRHYEYVKSIVADFVPQVESSYLDTQNAIVYTIDKVIFTDSKIALIVHPRFDDDKELYNSFAAITSPS